MTYTKTKSAQKNRQATAYREAGHAVTAWHSGILLESLSINPKKGKSKENVWNNPFVGIDLKWVRQVRPDMLIERLALVCLAGPAAERRFNPKGVRESASKKQIQNADTLLKQLVDSRAEQIRQRRKLESKAKNLMNRRDLWKMTERLAGILAERGTLSGGEATKILEETK